MKKSVLGAVAALLLAGTFAFAQSDNGAAQDQSSRNSASSNAGAQTVEGCISRKGSTYYINTASGERMALLEHGQDLGGHVNHYVRLTGVRSGGGLNDPNAQNNENNMQASTQPSGAPVGRVGAETFRVTGVDMLSDSCPAGTKTK